MNGNDTSISGAEPPPAAAVGSAGTRDPARTDAPLVLEVRGLSKRFDMTQALRGVSLSLRAGEIHALVGENGAGKSTLIKILTGIEQADEGEVRVGGASVRLADAQEAQACGVAAIYQEPLVFPDLDVAENIFITHRDQGVLVRWKRMYAEAEDLLASLGVRLDVRASARGLTLASQQAVEIAKAISLRVKILIMDEPTASLSDHEVRQLFRVACQLRDRGVAVLFISHRLEEVFEIADRITVLRDGEHISTHPAAEVTRELLIREMVGREVDLFYGAAGPTRPIGKRVLRVRGLGRDGVFTGIEFDLHAGEVLGFAGLVGSRRTDVALALFGIQPADAGSIEIEGRAVRIASPRAAQRLGIAYMTEDRRKLGLAMPLSIAANVTLPVLRRYLTRFGLIDRAREERAAEGFRQRLDIKAPSPLHVVGKLSGGNQQKVMFGKWLNTRPKIFLLDEPTRGIDVGAKAEVHAMVRELAGEGMAILCISSDLPEVLALSDRILVMREGRQMGVLGRGEATQEAVMSLATGQAGGTAAAGASAAGNRSGTPGAAGGAGRVAP